MLLADPLLGSHSWSCPSCSLPKRNSIHCARAASSSSSCLFPQCSSLYTQQPRCSHQPFYTFPLLLASFHRSLLSASTQRFVQRTKLLCLPVWLSSASALVTTAKGIVHWLFLVVPFMYGHMRWKQRLLIDNYCTGHRNQQPDANPDLQLKTGFVSVQFWTDKNRMSVRYRLRYSALEGHMWAQGTL